MARVHPIPDAALGNTSYLVEIGDATAVAVDPRRDVDEHLLLAERLGVRIAAVLETHLHADFVGGAPEIAEATGAELYAAAEAALSFPHRPVHDGEGFAIGAATIEVLSTPGHTPEHIAFLVTAGGEQALFSGGSLIVGGAARTDLTGAEHTDALARAQFQSLRRLASLPDHMPLYPTHGAGSFCSTGPARSATSTIGDERRSNRLFMINNEDEFVEALRAGFGTYPRYFANLRTVNQAGAPLLRTLPAVSQIAAEAAQDAAGRGAWLIDGRSTDQWAHAHPAGSVSIAVRDAFASWLGWVVPFGAPVVLLLDPAQFGEAVRQAHRIGYDRIRGWTTFEAWRDAGLPVSSVELLEPNDAAQRAARGALMLDVRQQSEWSSGRIPGATHLELGDLIAGKTPEAAEVVAYCGQGERSATAASLLERRGLRAAHLRGGAGAWRRAGLPLER